MSDFAPSLSHAAAAGHKVVRQTYPEGVAGVALSLDTIAVKIREGQLDKDVKGWASDAIIAAGRPRTIQGQAQALLDAIRGATVYLPDPVNTEYIQSAATTLCLRPGLCIRGGDCDDLTTLYGSVLAAVGIPVRVVKQRFSMQDQEHVLIEFQDENGNWLAADPSTSYPVGRKVPAMEEFTVDPWAPSFAGLEGPPPEFVGIGRAPRHVFYIGLGDTSSSASGSSASGALNLPPAPNPAVPNPAPYANPAADLANELSAVISQGDAALASGNAAQALASYQAAGMTGATAIGPEIDLAGYPQVTQPLTQQAWQLNGDLQSTTDATIAQDLVRQMQLLYETAIDCGQEQLARQAAGALPAGQSPADGVTVPQALGIAFAAGAAGGLLWHLFRAGNRATPRRRR